MTISMLKIRRLLGRLIFNMGIAIPGKTVFLIETAPWICVSHDQAFNSSVMIDISRPFGDENQSAVDFCDFFIWCGLLCV